MQHWWMWNAGCADYKYRIVYLKDDCRNLRNDAGRKKFNPPEKKIWHKISYVSFAMKKVILLKKVKKPLKKFWIFPKTDWIREISLKSIYGFHTNHHERNDQITMFLVFSILSRRLRNQWSALIVFYYLWICFMHKFPCSTRHLSLHPGSTTTHRAELNTAWLCPAAGQWGRGRVRSRLYGLRESTLANSGYWYWCMNQCLSN